MKIQKIFNIKNNYIFEAPLYKAASKFGYSLNDTKLDSINLSKTLVKNPDTTYLVKVVGNSMIDENIDDGDVLVVDYSETTYESKIVIASLNGEMAVKKYQIIDGKPYLISANKQFLPVEIKPFWNFEIQGVVKYVIKNF